MRKLKKLGITMAIVSLAACTSVPLAPEGIGVKAKEFSSAPTVGVLYIYRKYKFAGAGLIYPIAVNGTIVGALKAGTFLRVQVKPGPVQITSWSTAHQSALSLTISAKEIKYVSTSTHVTGESFLIQNAGRVSLEEISPNVAKSDIQKLALVNSQ